MGLDIYLEWGKDDYSPNSDSYLRYPFHTEGWTFGIQKSFLFRKYYGLIQIELTHLECSADYDRIINWYTTFYGHHKIIQGYTNKGQWIGAGIGTGGNSQYLAFKFFSHKGDLNFFVQRRNPDLDYTMYIDNRKNHDYAERNIRVFFDFGLTNTMYLTNKICLFSMIVFTDEHNPLNFSADYSSEHRYNVHCLLNLKYSL